MGRFRKWIEAGAVILLLYLGVRGSSDNAKIIEYEAKLVAWRLRDEVKLSRYLRGETETYEMEPLPKWE